MSRVAAAVARAKTLRPGEFCMAPGCLWRTGGGYCERHAPKTAPAPSQSRVGRSAVAPVAAATARGRAQHVPYEVAWMRDLDAEAEQARALVEEARVEARDDDTALVELARDADDARGGERYGTH